MSNNQPENLAAAYKDWSGGEVSKPTLSGGAGDASLSPSHVHGHTPGASLGAVRGPAIAPEAQEDSQPIRILLSEAASKHLTATGERAFVIVHKVMRGTEEPETMGRWALYLVPCPTPAANAAVRVARGLSAERKPKAAPRASSTQDGASQPDRPVSMPAKGISSAVTPSPEVRRAPCRYGLPEPFSDTVAT